MVASQTITPKACFVPFNNKNSVRPRFISYNKTISLKVINQLTYIKWVREQEKNNMLKTLFNKLLLKVMQVQEVSLTDSNDYISIT